MTRPTNARVAGAMFLLYIALAFPAMVLDGRATAGEGTAAKLATVASHATTLRVTIVLTMGTCFVAFALAVALYGLTRDEDRELAVFALCCRVAEGMLNAVSPLSTFALLWLTSSGSNRIDRMSAAALGGLLLKIGGSFTLIGSTLFAVGSTVFAYLLLRSQAIPSWLAWLGTAGSALLAVVLVLQMGGLMQDSMAQLVWLPVAAFELILGPWLLIKGVAPSTRRP